MSDEELIDYTDPDIIARQNIAPNAGCNIDGKFYDVRNLVHLASSQADRIEELTAELAGARDDAKGAEAKALRAAADMTLGLSNARACRTAILAMIPKGDSHD